MNSRTAEQGTAEYRSEKHCLIAFKNFYCSIFDIQNIKEAESHSKRHCKCDSFQPQAEPTISDLALRSRFSREEAEHSYGDASILITTRVRSSSDLRPKVKLFSSP